MYPDGNISMPPKAAPHAYGLGILSPFTEPVPRHARLATLLSFGLPAGVVASDINPRTAPSPPNYQHAPRTKGPPGKAENMGESVTTSWCVSPEFRNGVKKTNSAPCCAPALACICTGLRLTGDILQRLKCALFAPKVPCLCALGTLHVTYC